MAEGDIALRVAGAKCHFDVSPSWLTRVLQSSPKRMLRAVAAHLETWLALSGAGQWSRLEPGWGEAAQMAPDDALDQRTDW